MTTQEYTFRIQRNTPDEKGGMTSRWQEFKISAEPGTTILTCLEEIKRKQDGTLTFRQSCRSAICGSCAIRIGGRTRLACKTHVGKVAKDGLVEIGPQNNQPVLKDLAIDISNFFQKVRSITPYLQQGSESATKVTSTAYDQVNHVTQCILCGCCYSDCTMAEVSKEFIGPAALAKAFRFVSDPREGKKSDRLNQLSEPHGIWSCSRCTMCVEVCPKEVAPMEAIVKLRTRGVAKGLTDSAGARHALAFHGDIQKSGSLNEFTLMFRTLGFLGSLMETDMAIHLAKKGKVPSPFPHAVDGVEELRRMYQHLEQNPLEVETKAKEAVPE
ncbi:MAG: succinate dehydrogenase iron-sulfur subunit [Magnetococcales bacterium]|nr:succinate dehydrogenase iron-sulfur subunit [Magnetococcales bacterium]NGZ26064.1 succinate dehydrogenase iron-sulfur subunit [Magnetococcales bacterium]